MVAGRSSTRRWVLAALLIVAGGTILYSGRPLWFGGTATTSAAVDDADEHEHGGNSETVMLSEKAKANLNLQTMPAVLTDYWQTLTVPGNVVEQPGHAHRKIVAPVTGIVTEIYVHPNQLVRPGDLMAELELTGDALATAQADLLATIRELELNQRELDRVEPLVQSGSLPEKNRLQLEYERKRLESQRASKGQALEVLGLSQQQVEEIAKTEKLLRDFRILVPDVSAEEKTHLVPPDQRSSPLAVVPKDYSYTVESIDVFPGKRVEIGEEICSLAFHVMLFIEGQAFEKESDLIERAMVEKWPIKAIFESGSRSPLVRNDLHILLLDNVIDPGARTFRFFVPIGNEVLHDSKGNRGETYRSWRFKPGQKVTLEIPVAQLPGVFVLPNEAVVREGPEAYVFRVNGSKLERQGVTVVASDRQQVAIKNDGSIFPGEVLAANSAYQLNLALKKASGSGIDPHAGHSHAH